MHQRMQLSRALNHVKIFLKHLRSACAAGCHLGEQFWRACTGLAGLTELRLTSCWVLNEDVKSLRGLVNLQMLALGDSRIGDGSLPVLQSLSRLTYLDISNNLISLDPAAHEAWGGSLFFHVLCAPLFLACIL